MGKINCLVVDDEPHAIELLTMFIDKVPFLNLYNSTTSSIEAVSILEQEPIEVLFLDIQMEELTGFQLLNITEYKGVVIVTSAYSEYALSGYDYNIVDYLLKPFSFERFLKAINKARHQLSEKNRSSETENENVTSGTLFVKGDAKHKFHQVKFVDILFIEGLKNYVRFICTNENIITLQNIKDLEKKLPHDQFIRIHRSYIVNIKYIEKIDGNMVYINNKPVPVGRTYRETFYEFVNNRKLI